MEARNPPEPAVQTRLRWWQIGVGCLAGVIGGALVFLALQLPITFVLDQLFGRSAWVESMSGWPQPVGLGLLVLYWAIPILLGQGLAVVFTGWSKGVFLAAAFQFLNVVIIFSDFEFLPLWLLPIIIALILSRLHMVAAAAAMGRAHRAKRALARNSDPT